MKKVGRLDEVESIFLEDLTEDYEGIWKLADMVRDHLGVADPGVVREITLKLTKDWLVSGFVRAGMPHGYDSGFDAWPNQGEEAAQRIATEWSDTGRLPTLGEITWFDITPEGKRLVSQS